MLFEPIDATMFWLLLFAYLSAPILIGMIVGVCATVRYRGCDIILGWAIGLGMGILTLSMIILVLILDVWLIGGVAAKARTDTPIAMVYWTCCTLGAIVTVFVVRAVSGRKQRRVVIR